MVGKKNTLLYSELCFPLHIYRSHNKRSIFASLLYLYATKLNFSYLQDEDTRFVLGHDEALSHLIFAGSDIILCQSFHDHVFQVPVSFSLLLPMLLSLCFARLFHLFLLWKVPVMITTIFKPKVAHLLLSSFLSFCLENWIPNSPLGIKHQKYQQLIEK